MTIELPEIVYFASDVGAFSASHHINNSNNNNDAVGTEVRGCLSGTLFERSPCEISTNQNLQILPLPKFNSTSAGNKVN